MITLERIEPIDVFQVELALRVKAKRSPFIAILILAQEEDGVSAKTLQEKLLPMLPLRACSNLLRRLEQQGYLSPTYQHSYDDNFSDEHLDYVLTDLGFDCAEDKSYWVGEKGIYNVWVSENLFNSQISNYHIIRIERAKQLSDDRNEKYVAGSTPPFLSAYQKMSLTIHNSEYLVEEVESRCFQLPTVNAKLRLKAIGNDTTLSVNVGEKQIFKTEIDIDELTLQNELLARDEGLNYDIRKRSIRTDFDSKDLSFTRKTMVASPIFRGMLFNRVELEGIPHIPSDVKNADLWYSELLLRNMNDYFFDEKDFTAYASKWALPFQEHFKIKVPTRKGFKKALKGKEGTFYSVAKLETIDYLSY